MDQYSSGGIWRRVLDDLRVILGSAQSVASAIDGETLIWELRHDRSYTVPVGKVLQFKFRECLNTGSNVYILIDGKAVLHKLVVSSFRSELHTIYAGPGSVVSILFETTGGPYVRGSFAVIIGTLGAAE